MLRYCSILQFHKMIYVDQGTFISLLGSNGVFVVASLKRIVIQFSFVLFIIDTLYDIQFMNMYLTVYLLALTNCTPITNKCNLVLQNNYIVSFQREDNILRDVFTLLL